MLFKYCGIPSPPHPLSPTLPSPPFPPSNKFIVLSSLSKALVLFRVEVDIECFDRFAEHRFVCSRLGCHKFGGKCVENVVQVFSRVRQHQCFLPSIVCDVVANEYVVGQSFNPLCPAYPLAFRLTFKRWIRRERLGHDVARGNSGMQQTV